MVLEFLSLTTVIQDLVIRSQVGALSSFLRDPQVGTVILLPLFPSARMEHLYPLPTCPAQATLMTRARISNNPCSHSEVLSLQLGMFSTYGTGAGLPWVSPDSVPIPTVGQCQVDAVTPLPLSPSARMEYLYPLSTCPAQATLGP